MSGASGHDATQMLADAGRGDTAAAEKLMPVVYDELHRLAAGYLRHERPGHTLQPTALIHEAYLRLVDQTRAGDADRTHFVGLAARAMRQVLVDHARQHGSEKRGRGLRKLSLDEAMALAAPPDADLLALTDALQRLAELDERKGRLVELRFFGGLTVPESAQVLGVSQTTAEDDWRVARAWLRRELDKDGAS